MEKCLGELDRPLHLHIQASLPLRHETRDDVVERAVWEIWDCEADDSALGSEFAFLGHQLEWFSDDMRMGWYCEENLEFVV